MKKTIICILVWATPLLSREEGTADTLTEGNLALPTSQQPACLFGFGQNLVDKGDILGYMDIFHLATRRGRATSLTPNFLYGITDALSLYVGLPIATKFQEDNYCSSGAADLFVQCEYAYHNKDAHTYANQMTLVGNITLPTGSAKKSPPVGLGAPSFFLGTTASHLSTGWYVYGSLGMMLTTSHKGTRFGNSFVYQSAVGRNIGYRADRWILTAMIEFDGIYSSRDTTKGVCDPNSGGNIFYIGPCFWFSTQRFNIQAGIQFPVAQHLFGRQTKEKWSAALSIGCKFNSPAL